MTKPSGKFVVRIPPDLHEEAKRKAADSGISLNEYCIRALSSCAAGSDGDRHFGDSYIETASSILSDSLLSVMLFGSTARGEARDDSDVDLLIVVKPTVPLTRALYEAWDVRNRDDLVSPHFVHLPEDPLSAGSVWYETALDGVLLYESGRSVSRFLGRIRRAIADGLIERRTAYGKPYWIKNNLGDGHA